MSTPDDSSDPGVRTSNATMADTQPTTKRKKSRTNPVGWHRIDSPRATSPTGAHLVPEQQAERIAPDESGHFHPYDTAEMVAEFDDGDGEAPLAWIRKRPRSFELNAVKNERANEDETK